MQTAAFGNIVLAFIQMFQNIIISKNGCRWCELAKDLLESQGIDYNEFTVTEHRYIIPGGNMRNIHIQEIQDQFLYRFYPMIFLNGEFIKGYAELLNLVETGRIEYYKNGTRFVSQPSSS